MFFEFQDIQQAVDALPGLRLDYRQLEAGPLRITIELQALGEIGCSLAGVNRLVEGHGQVEPGHTTFVLCLEGGENRYDDLSLAPGQVYIKGCISSLAHQQVKPGYSALLLNVPCRLLEDHLRCPLAAGLTQGAVLDLNSRVTRAILALVREPARASAQGQRQLSDQIARALCHGLSLESVDDAPSRLDTKAQLVRAARERLQECAEMTFGDICSDLCVSERTLRRAFGEAYAMSPGQYHLAVRLNQVRAELKERTATKGAVSQIAARRGFWHMGRFCEQYRRLFGETPTQTLGLLRT